MRSTSSIMRSCRRRSSGSEGLGRRMGSWDRNWRFADLQPPRNGALTCGKNHCMSREFTKATRKRESLVVWSDLNVTPPTSTLSRKCVPSGSIVP